MAQLVRRALLALDVDDDDSDSVDDARAGPSDLTPAQMGDLRAVIVACCALSMLGCAAILFHYARSVLARRRSGVAGNSCARANVVPKMVVVLSLLVFGISFPKVFGVPDDIGFSARAKALCQTQGFVLQFAGLASVCWNACLAHCLYRKIVCSDTEQVLHRRLKFYVVASAVPAIVGSCVVLITGKYGSASWYCWIPDRKWQFWCLYLYVIIAIVYVGAILLITQRHILRIGSSQRSQDVLESSARITLNLRLYIGIFIVMWLPSTIFRLLGDYLGSATFAFAILMQVTLCIQGFAIAVVYGGLLPSIRQMLVMASGACFRLACCRRRLPNEYKGNPSELFPTLDAEGDDDGSDKFGDDYQSRTRSPASIFVSTFNLGEAKISSSELEAWIPLGYDMYVIGLQECLHLQETRALLLRHLETGGSGSGGSKFYMFNREIGSTNTSLGYHGHIAISVFIQAQDVESGAFYMPPVVRQQVNCGKSLVLGRASNKGAVGVAFRYYDTSFAFVSCHLSSDSKGKSRVHKRNRDMVDILKGLHLNLEDVGVEFPFLHHHSFVLGDLNYRLTHRGASVDDVLDLVSSIRAGEIAASKNRSKGMSLSVMKSRWSWSTATASMKKKIKKKRRTESSDLNARMLSQPLQSATSSICSVDEIDHADTHFTLAHDDSSVSTNSALVDDDYREWDDLLEHDELRNLMRDEKVFYGFEEAPIAFPPTFRRERGAAGLTRDPTRKWTREQLDKVYTTILPHGSQRGGVVYDGSNVVPAAAQVRVPSYTDRILFRSLPDMRKRLHCSLYTSCESVSCSDHKPVVGIFHVLVDRTRLPAESEAALRKIERMEHIGGVRECTLRVSYGEITWNDPPSAKDGSSRTVVNTSSSSEERPSLLFDRHASQAFVTIVFPLPSEDIFAAQRRLHELADAVSGGIFLGSGNILGGVSGGYSSVSSVSTASTSSSFEDRRGRRRSSVNAIVGNAVHTRWLKFVRSGASHTTLARPAASTMHVAIKVHSGVGQRAFGQGVICVPLPTRSKNSSASSPVIRHEFCVELSDSGRHTATMRGTISLEVARLSSSIRGDKDEEEPEAEVEAVDEGLEDAGGYSIV